MSTKTKSTKRSTVRKVKDILEGKLTADTAKVEAPVEQAPPVAATLEQPTQMEAPAVNPLRGHSTVDRPVNFTWMIADRMATWARLAGQAAPKRKDVVNQAISEGVAYFTARTQYQAWYKHTMRGARLISEGNAIPTRAKKEAPAADEE